MGMFFFFFFAIFFSRFSCRFLFEPHPSDLSIRYRCAQSVRGPTACTMTNLRLQKRLAASLLNCGKRRVWCVRLRCLRGLTTTQGRLLPLAALLFPRAQA